MGINELRINKLNKQLSEMANKQWCDFILNTGMPNWGSFSVNSGTQGYPSGTPKHPGVMSYVSSSTANSGSLFRANGSALLLGGLEKTTIIFKTATTLTGVTRRMGFHDSIDQTAPVDGAYCSIIDGVIQGKTATLSVSSTTTSNYSVTSDTWYRLVIQINSNATLVTFTLYQDDSSTILWTDTLNSNIPTTTGRETAHCDVCTYSGTSAITLGYIDYMDIVLPNARRIV